MDISKYDKRRMLLESRGNMKPENRKKSEKGAVLLVEATLIFPIMFIIVFLMIMAGEAYYQHARVEYVVTQAAISGAARCENPMLSYIENNGNEIPVSTTDVKVRPYRYILTSEAKNIDSEVKSELKKSIEEMKPLLWANMSPKNVSISGTTKVNPLISSFQVQCDFDIELPIRMIFSNENFKFHYTVSMVETIGDPSELVRNVSMIEDIMERFEKLGKIKENLNRIAEKVGTYLN
jgi:hypothetical protein